MRVLLFLLIGLNVCLSANVQIGKDIFLRGEPVANSDLLTDVKDKPVVVYWGSFKCPRCTSQKKDLARLAKSGQRKGYAVICVQSEMMEQEELTDAVKKSRIKAPFYFATNFNVRDENLSGKVRSGIPKFSVFDAEGKFVESFSQANEARRAADKLSR